VEIAERLREINRRFYTAQAGAFAETRRRIQPGVARVLAGLPDEQGAEWLDLGCGSGWLAVEWARAGRVSTYTGLDFSADLLAEARRQFDEQCGGSHSAGVDFRHADFGARDWEKDLPSRHYAGGLCFAVLHHIPGGDDRARFLRQAAGLLRAGGILWLSVWQFHHSPRLLARQLAWEQAGMSEGDVEPGDALLDWRRTSDGAPALRYVHRFEVDELTALAESAGFHRLALFESDGQGGRLGLYSAWTTA